MGGAGRGQRAGGAGRGVSLAFFPGAFPLRTICGDLEQLTSALEVAVGGEGGGAAGLGAFGELHPQVEQDLALGSSTRAGWVVDAVLEAGVPYDELFDAYAGLIDRTHARNETQVGRSIRMRHRLGYL